MLFRVASGDLASAGPARADKPAQQAGPARRQTQSAKAPAASTSLALSSAQTRDDPDFSKLSTSFLLDAALGMLDRAGFGHGKTIGDLRSQLRAHLEVQTAPDLHERAERLVRTLHRI